MPPQLPARFAQVNEDDYMPKRDISGELYILPARGVHDPARPSSALTPRPLRAGTDSQAQSRSDGRRETAGHESGFKSGRNLGHTLYFYKDKVKSSTLVGTAREKRNVRC